MKHRINLRTDLPMLPLLLIGSLLVAVITWVSSLPMQANYPNLVVKSAYFEDPESLETIDTIQKREFKDFTGPFFRRNNQTPLWLRLTLAPSSNPDWVAMFQPNFVHEVEAWVPSSRGGWEHAVVGSKHAYSNRDIQSLVPSVKVSVDPQAQVVMYARVVSPTTPLYAQVLTAKDAEEFNALWYLVGGVSFGIGMLAGLISFMVFLATRDSLWLLDSFYNFFGLLALSLQLGLFSSLFAPHSHNLVNQLGLLTPVMYLVLSALLYYRIFRLFVLPKWITWPNLLIAGASVYSIFLIATGHGDKAMALNNLLVFLLTLVGVLVVFLVRHPDRSLVLAFRFFYFITILYFLWWSVSMVLQQQTENFVALYPALPVALFSMLMLVLILVRNTQLKIQQALRVELQRKQAESELEQARMRHEETNSFYGMLLHEVKNPLSTIRMAVSNLEYSLADQDETVQKRLKRVQDSVDHVDEVLRRGVAVDMLEQGALMLEIRPSDIASTVEKACLSNAEVHRIDLIVEARPTAHVDEHMLYLMLVNLLDNAAKYSKPNSRILVLLGEGEQQGLADQWLITVRNEAGAAGYPAKDEVFGKYYRSPDAIRLASSGMGLGLYWVRGVARKMGGDAIYEREQEQVVFKLCLPT